MSFLSSVSASAGEVVENMALRRTLACRKLGFKRKKEARPQLAIPLLQAISDKCASSVSVIESHSDAMLEQWVQWSVLSGANPEPQGGKEWVDQYHSRKVKPRTWDGIS